MVSITAYGGVGEIGGNKVLVEDKDTKIFLDFGMSFGRRSMFFEEFLKPRACNGMADLLFTGLLPQLKGVYRKDLLQMAGMEVHKETNIDGVFLSHPHADHANYISFLDEEIPIYCGETTLLVLKAIQEAGVRDIEKEIINYKKRPMLRKDYLQNPTVRKFNAFRTGHKIKIGSLEVEPIHVDHSVPGAYGFIIHTTEGAIVYTGDVRMHGLRADMTEEFIVNASETKPIALITEGTRVGSDSDKSEDGVKTECTQFVSNAKGLVVADFNFKDTDRFKTFYSIAKAKGRKLAISTKDAMMLRYLSEDSKLGLPKLNDETISVFKQKAASGTYADEDYVKWERPIFDSSGASVVTANDIKSAEDKFIFVGGFFSINDMIDILPALGSSYIYSHSEPFNEEMEIDYKRLQNWISLLKLNFHNKESHCSGHADWSDLKDLVRRINAKAVFPVHTEHPEAFKEASDNVKLVEYAKSISLK